MGADILNPLQFSAKDINIKEIKRNFGKDICFWAAGSTRSLLSKRNASNR